MNKFPGKGNDTSNLVQIILWNYIYNNIAKLFNFQKNIFITAFFVNLVQKRL